MKNPEILKKQEEWHPCHWDVCWFLLYHKTNTFRPTWQWLVCVQVPQLYHKGLHSLGLTLDLQVTHHHSIIGRLPDCKKSTEITSAT